MTSWPARSTRAIRTRPAMTSQRPAVLSPSRNSASPDFSLRSIAAARTAAGSQFLSGMICLTTTRSQPVYHQFNCQTAKFHSSARHRPYSWRRRVRRVSAPLAGPSLSPRANAEGVERQAAHQSSVSPRPLVEDAGASRRSTAAISVPPRAAPSSGSARLSAFGSTRIRRLSPQASGPPAAPSASSSRAALSGRRAATRGLPGTGLRAPPAGAASHPASMTSHDNALEWMGRNVHIIL